MKAFLLAICVIVVGAFIVVLYSAVSNLYAMYMERYRQKLKKMSDVELLNEKDRIYRKILWMSAFFEYGQNINRYNAVVEEINIRGLVS